MISECRPRLLKTNLFLFIAWEGVYCPNGPIVRNSDMGRAPALQRKKFIDKDFST